MMPDIHGPALRFRLHASILLSAAGNDEPPRSTSSDADVECAVEMTARATAKGNDDGTADIMSLALDAASTNVAIYSTSRRRRRR